MHLKLRFLTIVFSFLLIDHTVAQCNLFELPLSQKVNNSTDIFEGKVKSKTCFWNAQHTLIFTSNTIEVYKVFKGGITASQVEVITEGGIVGDKMHSVEPSLVLTLGDIGIFTAGISVVNDPLSATDKNSVFQCYGSLQGFFKYDMFEKSATVPFKRYNDIQNDLYMAIENIIGNTYNTIASFDVNRRESISKASPSITSFSPATITAGTKSVLTIDGGGFGATRGTSEVRFKNADDGGATYISVLSTSQYISWSDTQIKVQVPDNAGTGTIRVVTSAIGTSTGTLTVSYAEMNTPVNQSSDIAYQTDHVNRNTAGGLTWQMYTGFNSNTAAKESMTRAINTWRCTTHINWTIGATTTVNTIANDNTSVIRFDIGSELSAGVLGQCMTYWSGCSSSGTTVYYVEELDMVIDDGTNWEFGPAAPAGSKYDFESVMLHELGHGHQLGHVIKSSDVMNYAVANASSRRILNANNKAAGDDIMSRSVVANVCGPGAMTALTGQCAIGGPVADFSGTPVSGCAPLSVTFTDATTNTPTSWAWDIDNNGTTDYTTQSPTHVYNAAGNYTVKLKVSNANGVDSIIKTNYIIINPLPVAAFSNTVNSGTVDFTNTSSNADSYSWDFGDSSSPSIATNPSHTYASANTYTIILTATNSCGSNDFSQEITIITTVPADPPVADFSGTPVSGCGSLSVTFSDLSTNTPTSWAWDIDNDGVVDYTTQSPTHIYNAPGNYSVKLKVGNVNGYDSITKVNYVTVNANPTATVPADFSVCSEQMIMLNPFSSTPAGASYSWTNSNTGIGIAASGNGNLPMFDAANTSNTSITATITVTPTLNGCTGNSSSFTITVKPKPTVVSVPNDITVCRQVQVTGTSFTSTPAGATFAWTNSNTAIGLAANGSGDVSSFTTTNNTPSQIIGNITVSPTLNGCTGTSSSYSISVDQIDDATFSYFRTTLCQSDNDQTPTINFSGGTFSSSPGGLSINVTSGVISVATSNLGTYTITYFTNGPCPNSSTVSVTITNNPDASFSYNSPFCENATLNPLPAFPSGASAGTFSSTTGLNFVNVATGEIDLSATPAGDYTITNSIAASGGCPSATATNTVTINAPPVSGFSYTVVANTVNVTNSSTNADTYSWEFGDSTTSVSMDDSHSYAVAGTYTVVLTATNSCGSDQTIQEITIIDNGIGINETTVNNAFLIYPNPSAGCITIEFTEEANLGNISVFNYLGEAVTSLSQISGSKKIILNLSSMANGVYCIVGNVNGKVVSENIVLVK